MLQCNCFVAFTSTLTYTFTSTALLQFTFTLKNNLIFICSHSKAFIAK